MANGFESLRQLADVLNLETARLSGDPQRLQLALGETQARKAQEMDALLNQQIDKMSLPDVQKTFLKAMTAKDKYSTIFGSKDRRIVKGADGYNYYVNPDGSFQRVFPGIEKEIASKDIDIFTIVNPQGNPAGNIVNPTEKEISDLNKKGYVIERLPTVSQKRSFGDVEFFDKTRQDVKSRFTAYSNFTNLANKLIKEIEEKPLGGLAAGSAGALADRILAEIQGSKNIIDKAKETGAYETDLSKFESKFTDAGIATEKQKTMTLNLAYQFAAAKGQEGRGLSDKDFDNALRVVGSKGNPLVRIDVLQNIIDDLGSEVTNFFNTEKIDLDVQRSVKPAAGIDNLLQTINEYEKRIPKAYEPSLDFYKSYSGDVPASGISAETQKILNELYQINNQ